MLIERFGAAELKDNHSGCRALEMLLQRRKTEIARLRKYGVAFPREIAKAQVQRAIMDREQRLEMPGMLRRDDVRSAQERDDIIGAQGERLRLAAERQKKHEQCVA